MEQITEEIFTDKPQSRGIGPDYCDIHKYQKPGTHIAMIIAKGLCCISQCSSTIGKLVHQVMIVNPDDEHHKGSKENSQSRTKWSCLGKKSCPGHDKSTPSHSTSKGKCPDMNGGKKLIKTLFLIFGSCTSQ